jgi:hypothetical protein
MGVIDYIVGYYLASGIIAATLNATAEVRLGRRQSRVGYVVRSFFFGFILVPAFVVGKALRIGRSGR